MKRGGAEDLAEGRGGKRSWNLPLDIEWRGLVVERAYRLDLLVDDLVVVEAKAEWRSACSSISVSGLSKTVESSG
ncbi:GxxExxY protein [Mesoterricola sediminis]|uniref:GxxExxY protein n=1 Tax=Mesoterricola sediminis TaxID=2927980 RepID=UPI002930B09B|nr:GxxExxY protein [Mesoterricola sediminis]